MHLLWLSSVLFALLIFDLCIVDMAMWFFSI